MATRIVAVSGDNLKLETLVKARRLETVSVQDHLAASARDRLGLRSRHQTLAISTIATVPPYPKIANFAASTPGPTVEACNDRSVLLAHQIRKDSAVFDAGPLEIVLIDAIFEKTDVVVGKMLVDGRDLDIEIHWLYSGVPLTTPRSWWRAATIAAVGHQLLRRAR